MLSNTFVIISLCNLSIDLINALLNKSDIIYWYNIAFFLRYGFYKKIKVLLIKLYVCVIHFFIVIFHINIPEGYTKAVWFFFYGLKQRLKYLASYFFKRFFKWKRLLKRLYRFGTIDYLKIVFFILFIIYLSLIWQKRHLYKKRIIFWHLIKYYVLSLLLVSFTLQLCTNSFLCILMTLFIIFLYHIIIVLK